MLFVIAQVDTAVQQAFFATSDVTLNLSLNLTWQERKAAGLPELRNPQPDAYFSHVI